ncbi:MAG: WG repeat-containing protein [Bacteroidia bacterium]
MFPANIMMKAFFRTLIYGFLFLGLLNIVQAQNRAAVKRGSKWFFIDNAGTVVIHKLYDSVGDRFVNGLAPAMINGKWGYINTGGKMVIKNRFDKAYTFYNGYALVNEKAKWIVINTKGKTIWRFNEGNLEIDEFSEGIATGKTIDGHFYIIPFKGILKQFSLQEYTELQPFNNGLARVKKGGKFGFIDTSGHLKLPCIYDAAANFKDTITSVEVGGFYHIINKKGENIEPLPHIYDVVSFNRGIAVLPTPFQYTVYRSGGTQMKSDLQYGDNLVTTHVYPFSEDIALFWSQSIMDGFRFGYVLPDGKLLNPYRYEWARDFSNGLAAVKLNGQYGYINRTGEMVIDAIYDNALNFYPVK